MAEIKGISDSVFEYLPRVDVVDPRLVVKFFGNTISPKELKQINPEILDDLKRKGNTTTN